MIGYEKVLVNRNCKIFFTVKDFSYISELMQSNLRCIDFSIEKDTY